MTIQERIDSGLIRSGYKVGYREGTMEELLKDFPLLSDSLKVVHLYGHKKIAILKDLNREKFYVLYLFTEKNSYCIHICDNYLGCGESSRYQEPLEDWTRGRDLPDGKCNLETWNRILWAIIGNELVNYDTSRKQIKIK